MTCFLVAFASFWIGVYVSAKIAQWYYKQQ
jgi:hypothetical protein